MIKNYDGLKPWDWDDEDVRKEMKKYSVEIDGKLFVPWDFAVAIGIQIARSTELVAMAYAVKVFKDKEKNKGVE